MRNYPILALIALSLPTAAIAQAGPVGAPGRYVIVHSPHVQSDTVLLDTATGKTWQLTQDNSREGSPTAWAPMARIDNMGEMQQFVKDYPRKPGQ